jgi:hypothetical protein
MKIIEKDFSDDVQERVKAVKDKIAGKYGLNPGNNVNLLCEKLSHMGRGDECCYVECGVYQGTTLFTVAEFVRQEGLACRLVGLDSFQGFPYREIDPRDHPRFFQELYERGLIAEDHYRKAVQRTKGLTETGHLRQEYFLDVKRVFDIGNDFHKVHLIKGAFADTSTSVEEAIDVLFLDCDLYQSYRECLDGLYHRVVSEGVVVFDEYYSLKYPGPRLAVNEFFEDKEGRFETYRTDEGFERWCFVKG